MSRSRPVPSYRLHKPSGQAVVTIRTATGERRDVYLGVYDSPESRAEHGRVIAEQAAAPGVMPDSSPAARPTVDQVLVLFMAHAQQHYRRADGTLTDSVTEFRNAAKLHHLYGHTPAADFGPLALKAVRQQYIDAGNCRTLINSRIGKVRRIFRWAVAQELIPVATHSALTTLAGLEQGRTAARESEPVGPVDPAVVDATLPYAASTSPVWCSSSG